MAIFNRKAFNKLSQIHDTHCISIYMPTHIRNDEGEGYQKDKILLKNQLNEVEKQLKTFEMKDSEIDSYLKPIRELVDEQEFWLNQNRSLAIFYDGKELLTYQLPVSWNAFAFVNDHFYLKPLTTMLHGGEHYYLLALSMGDVKLYEAGRDSIFEIELPEEMPKSLEDVVGYDYAEKELQQRTQQGELGNANGMFHGHGSGNETEKKEEARQFMRKVNEVLEDFLKGEDTPLIVACVDYLFPIFKEVCTYDYLLNEFVAGNYEHQPLNDLHEKSWSVLQPYFEKEREESLKIFEGLINEGKSSADEKTAIPASIGGRTETLFIKENQTLWGTYQKDTHSIDIHEVRKLGDTDLLNLAAVETVNHGGKVYILPEDRMPVSNSEVNAIFRYSKN